MRAISAGGLLSPHEKEKSIFIFIDESTEVVEISFAIFC
jgi:hypothetical protein